MSLNTVTLRDQSFKNSLMPQENANFDQNGPFPLLQAIMAQVQGIILKLQDIIPVFCL